MLDIVPVRKRTEHIQSHRRAGYLGSGKVVPYRVPPSNVVSDSQDAQILHVILSASLNTRYVNGPDRYCPAKSPATRVTNNVDQHVALRGCVLTHENSVVEPHNCDV